MKHRGENHGETELEVELRRYKSRNQGHAYDCQHSLFPPGNQGRGMEQIVPQDLPKEPKLMLIHIYGLNERQINAYF